MAILRSIPLGLVCTFYHVQVGDLNHSSPIMDVICRSKCTKLVQVQPHLVLRLKIGANHNNLLTTQTRQNEDTRFITFEFQLWDQGFRCDSRATLFNGHTSDLMLPEISS